MAAPRFAGSLPLDRRRATRPPARRRQPDPRPRPATGRLRSRKRPSVRRHRPALSCGPGGASSAGSKRTPTRSQSSCARVNTAPALFPLSAGIVAHPGKAPESGGPNSSIGSTALGQPSHQQRQCSRQGLHEQDRHLRGRRPEQAGNDHADEKEHLDREARSACESPQIRPAARNPL